MEMETQDQIKLLCELLRGHSCVTFVLDGAGETTYTTATFKGAVEELEEKYGSK